MKVLVVCSGNKGEVSPFIKEQVAELSKLGMTMEYFIIEGKGLLGYLGNIIRYYKKIIKFRPQLVHAHYGLSGLFSNLQFFIPVITTYHGSDIHKKKNLKYSKYCAKLSKKNIYISEKLKKLNNDEIGLVIPCGVNVNLFQPADKAEIRSKLNWDQDKVYILFSSSFENSIKNYPLAKKAIDILTNYEIDLIELKGYTRAEVVDLLNGCDLALLTSFEEGSPQFIKEAMACNRPIVATDVGDVKKLLENVKGVYISDFEAKNVAINIEKALNYNKTKGLTNGRQKLLQLNLTNHLVAKKIISLYQS